MILDTKFNSLLLLSSLLSVNAAPAPSDAHHVPGIIHPERSFLSGVLPGSRGTVEANLAGVATIKGLRTRAPAADVDGNADATLCLDLGLGEDCGCDEPGSSPAPAPPSGGSNGGGNGGGILPPIPGLPIPPPIGSGPSSPSSGGGVIIPGSSLPPPIGSGPSGGGGVVPGLPLPPPIGSEPSGSEPCDPPAPGSPAPAPAPAPAPPSPAPAPAPGNGGSTGGSSSGGVCNTGSMNCCQDVQPAGSSKASSLLSGLGLVLQDLSVPIGITCTPVTLLGLGQGGSCTAAPVCCENDSFNGLVAIGCTPIIL